MHQIRSDIHQASRKAKEIWKPTFRDVRSYKDVVRTEKVKGFTTPQLQDWLKAALVCYNDHPLDPTSLNDVLKDPVLIQLQGSRLDDYSIIVSKLRDGCNVEISQEEQTVL